MFVDNIEWEIGIDDMQKMLANFTEEEFRLLTEMSYWMTDMSYDRYTELSVTDRLEWLKEQMYHNEDWARKIVDLPIYVRVPDTMCPTIKCDENIAKNWLYDTFGWNAIRFDISIQQRDNVTPEEIEDCFRRTCRPDCDECQIVEFCTRNLIGTCRETVNAYLNQEVERKKYECI